MPCCNALQCHTLLIWKTLRSILKRWREWRGKRWRQLSCGHIFHKECHSEWAIVNSACALCRTTTHQLPNELCEDCSVAAMNLPHVAIMDALNDDFPYSFSCNNKFTWKTISVFFIYFCTENQKSNEYPVLTDISINQQYQSHLHHHILQVSVVHSRFCYDETELFSFFQQNSS